MAQELSLPQIIDKLYEGRSVTIAFSGHTRAVADEQAFAFINNARTARSRTRKKFGLLGLSLDNGETYLDAQLSCLKVSDNEYQTIVVLALKPKKPVTYTVEVSAR